MLTVRKSNDRGFADHGWLQSFHSFSFSDYYDPAHMGFGPLRVINEDRVAPGQGFGTHGHRDMEIISYVLDGALEHKDSMGNGSVLHYGDVQRMSAGTGVRHSEFNHSPSAPVHFLQIWIEPDVKGIAPGYEEKTFAQESRQGRLQLIASPDGRDGSVLIHQDAAVYASILGAGDGIDYPVASGRKVYLHVATEHLVVNGIVLAAGDALMASDEKLLSLGQAAQAEVLLFDLPD
ncbi:quercetin 2,3-dioxygenase [mine drainage metagenome]|uniref:Quercetin 2,3-dioxygenase n=1 Tax=mine drainage metagenome TaxID=410659 RepID=A0A1J5TP13_9ZZZZ